MLLPFLLLSLFPASRLATHAPTRGRPVDFSLIVADCFHGDTVAIAVNGQDVLTAAATSDFSSGKTGISVYQDRQGLWVRVAGKTTHYPRLDLRQGLRLRVVLNGQASSQVVDLRKGWIVFVDACKQATGPGAPARRLSWHQYHKTVVLE